MDRIRPAAVAGTFYPGDREALAAVVRALLADVPASGEAGPPPKALIVPHAGYAYSGPIAASAYARVSALRGTIARVVLVGPAHREHVRGVAVPAAGAFATPLGDVVLDEPLLDRWRRLPFVETSDRAHALEHSLEVHLPFLAETLGSFALVPAVVGGASPDEVACLLVEAWGGPETLVVVSSDLSHFLPRDAARTRDDFTARAILEMRPTLVPDDACGAAPVNGLLVVARRRGMAAELLDLRNSADTAGGPSRVVGYGAFVFREADAAHG